MKKEKFCFVDWLRVGAACAVVMLHTVTGVMNTTDMSGFPEERMFFLGIMDMVTWCVPIFLMISGFLFLNPCKKITFVRMLKNNVSKIVLALFLFGVPFACLELVITSGSFSLAMLGEGVRMVLQGKSWSHLWYLYLILILYLFTPMMKRILSLVPIWTVYAVMLILLMGCSILPFVNQINPQLKLMTLPGDAIYLFYYLAGFLLHQVGYRSDGREGDSSEMKKTAVCVKWRIAILGMLALITGGAMIASRILGFQNQMAYNYPPTVLLAVLLVWMAKEAEEIWNKGGSIIEQMAALSFAVYLIHPVFLNVFYKFLHLTPLAYPVFLSVPLFFAVTLLLSVAGAWVLRRIPLFKKYIL